MNEHNRIAGELFKAIHHCVETLVIIDDLECLLQIKLPFVEILLKIAHDHAGN